MQRYLFFLRHYNDVDNITPAIFFFLNSDSRNRADLIFYHEGYDFHRDENIKFLLSEFDDRVSVSWLGSFFGISSEAEFKRFGAKVNLIGRLRSILVNFGFDMQLFLRRVNSRKYFNKVLRFAGRTGLISLEMIRLDLVDRSIVDEALRKVLNKYKFPTLVVFDVVRSYAVKGILNSLRRLGIKKVICLPVSPLINYNVLREEKFVDFASDAFLRDHDYSGFDAVGFVDLNFVDSYQKLLSLLGLKDTLTGRTKALGSIRYCSEWMAVRERYLIPAYGQLTSRKKVVFFLSRLSGNVNAAEVDSVLRILADFHEFDIVIKGHTRENAGSVLSFKNITLADDISSSSLIDWSDIIMFWSTSVAIEGYLKGKVMICLAYLSGNLNLYEKYNAGCIARCRDDVVKALHALSTGKDLEYSQSGQVKFIKEIVEAGGSSVPKNYLEFMSMHEF